MNRFSEPHTVSEPSAHYQEVLMIPTLGRIVHYCHQIHNGQPSYQAAIINKVESKPALGPDEKYDGEENAYAVDLTVFTSWGTDILKNVACNIDPEPKAGTWSWPPRT